MFLTQQKEPKCIIVFLWQRHVCFNQSIRENKEIQESLKTQNCHDNHAQQVYVNLWSHMQMCHDIFCIPCFERGPFCLRLFRHKFWWTKSWFHWLGGFILSQLIVAHLKTKWSWHGQMPDWQSHLTVMKPTFINLFVLDWPVTGVRRTSVEKWKANYSFLSSSVQSGVFKKILIR